MHLFLWLSEFLAVLYVLLQVWMVLLWCCGWSGEETRIHTRSQKARAKLSWKTHPQRCDKNTVTRMLMVVLVVMVNLKDVSKIQWPQLKKQNTSKRSATNILAPGHFWPCVSKKNTNNILYILHQHYPSPNACHPFFGFPTSPPRQKCLISSWVILSYLQAQVWCELNGGERAKTTWARGWFESGEDQLMWCFGGYLQFSFKQVAIL